MNLRLESVRMNQRSSGILLHISSLANRYSIGDLGPSSTAFADFMEESGQRWWQMLPIGPTGGGNSPYQSQSAFGGNSLLLSPDRLVECGFLDRKDIVLGISKNNEKVNYSEASRTKKSWLTKSYQRFRQASRGGSQAELDEFVRAESYWLDDYSLFCAIQENEGTANWTGWSYDLRTRKTYALMHARRHFANEIGYHQFVQWQFSVQWKAFRAYCLSKRIRLIGDIPLFVAHHSADVWAHPELFKLDIDGNPTVVAGVPPDYFSAKGQIWGVPVYNWEALQEQNYRWWIERMRTAFMRFDVNRLDHFIGFVRTYEVPPQATTAKQGHYQSSGGTSFFEALRNSLGSLQMIADDLGATTSEVTNLRNQLRIPGTRVLQFELTSQLEDNSVSKDPLQSVIYTGTHDNDTTEGWYEMLPGLQREALKAKLGVTDQEVVWAMIGEALSSQANTAIVPAQDLLTLGSEARMNFPGTSQGNWQWRLKDGELSHNLAKRLQNLAIKYDRL